MTFKRHFRVYLVNNHPAYIVGEEKNKFAFHRVTSSKTSGGKKNWKVSPNPDKTKKTPMYIVKKEQKAEKRKFSKFKLNWKLKKDSIKRAQKK